jgi:hypothetical protein
MTLFTICGRIRREGLVCDVALNAQVAQAIDAHMPWTRVYGRAS